MTLIAHTYPTAVNHFSLSLEEATNKGTPSATSIVWLGLLFDNVAMTVTLPPEKVKELLDLVTIWTTKQYAT